MAYEGFARLVVANRNFATWNRHGPTPFPPPGGLGLLHHMLVESRLLPLAELPAGGQTVDRLTAIVAPRSSPLAIRLEPRLAAEEDLTRDIEVTPRLQNRPFRVDDKVSLAFQANRDCYVTLIDVGTSSAIAIVLPNAWCPEARISGNRLHFFPGPEFNDFEFTLTGPPGRERVFGIASLTALPISWGPEGKASFRVMQAAEIDALVNALAGLDPGAWAACACDFEIQG
jgi:hypothetical protein